MKLIAPDYCRKFRCIAGRCRHSCCKGWEIDIDLNTLLVYKELKGNLGKRIKDSIEEKDGTASFIMTDDNCCPFLNEAGLCDIITEKGEDFLCEICSEHPRFYNDYSDRTEMGIGLCCEEAARLILTEDNTLFTADDDYEDDEQDENEKEFLNIRNDILGNLSDKSKPLSVRLSDLMKKSGYNPQIINPKDAAEFYFSLEKADDERDRHLSAVSECREFITGRVDEFSDEFEKLAVYFIYRNLFKALEGKTVNQMIGFSLISVYMIACAFFGSGNLTLGNLTDISRIYSSEIEYSDENIDRIISDFIEKT